MFTTEMRYRGENFEKKRKSPAQFETILGLATSSDGLHLEVSPKPYRKVQTDEIRRVYDPRLTVLDGVLHVCFAMDTQHGVRGGIARTQNLSEFEILSLSTPDNRNMVPFPKKTGSRYFSLERPFSLYSRGEIFPVVISSRGEKL